MEPRVQKVLPYYVDFSELVINVLYTDATSTRQNIISVQMGGGGDNETAFYIHSYKYFPSHFGGILNPKALL